MDLIPSELKSQIPRPGSVAESSLKERIAWVRLIDSESGFCWYVLEFDGDDQAFGIIVSKRLAVIGHFTFNELGNLMTSGGSKSVILDLSFSPVRLRELAVSEPLVGKVLDELSNSERAEGGLIQLD